MEQTSYPLPYLLGRGLVLALIIAVLTLGLFAGITALEPLVEG